MRIVGCNHDDPLRGHKAVCNRCRYINAREQVIAAISALRAPTTEPSITLESSITVHRFVKGS